MNVAEKIETKLSGMDEGTTFKYSHLGIGYSEYSAATKAIERLIGKGRVKRVSRGIFYIPRNTVFGELKPSEEELLKPHLFENGKRIAYVTGGTLYNRMGLTTQVPNCIQVASKVKRVTTQIGNTPVKPVKSYVDVTEDNYPLLEMLDAFKDYGSIPDLDVQIFITIMAKKIKMLSDRKLSKLVDYALNYPPRVTALLGALMDFLKNKHIYLENLKARLNPLTSYNLNIEKEALPTAVDWNIR